MIDLDRFWAGNDDESPRPPLTEVRISDWERRQGVRLPATLRSAFRRANGGSIRFTEIEILRLDEIRPIAAEDWDHAHFDDDEAPDARLVFVAGFENGIGGQFLLNYNANGSEGEPSLYLYFNDGTGASLAGPSVDAFLEEQLPFTSVPKVDWTESKEGLDVVAREGFDARFVDGGGGRVEQVLGRSDRGLVLYVRNEDGLGIRLSRTFLPLPLVPGMATIRPFRPQPGPTFALILYPEESAGIVHDESNQVKDGRWENRTAQGVPVYVQFESKDRGRLEQLRTTLFGSAAVPGAAPAAPAGPSASERLAALSPEDRKVAALLAARKVKAEKEQALGANPDPATAMFARLILDKMDEAIARAIADGAPEAADPETVGRVSDALWPRS